jgi:sulfur carrier protein ThiS
MGKALFRFYEELNDRLPPGQRKRDFEVALEGTETVREILEKMGVPPAEVDLLLANGQSVDLDYVLKEGDRISVYPVFERLDLTGVSRVREKPLRRLTFIVDRGLESVAESLKALGLDVTVGGHLGEEHILRMVKNEGRILLTRQEDFPGLQGLDRMIVLKTGSLREQVHQVIDALDLRDELARERDHERKERRETSEE